MGCLTACYRLNTCLSSTYRRENSRPIHTQPRPDIVIQGLLQLLIFQALGEVISMFLVPFIPGPVVGLVLLLGFLVSVGRVPQSMDLVGSGILQHLGLLFVPASVGVVMFWPLLKENALAVTAALLLSVVATIFVTATVLKRLGGVRAGDEHAP